MSASQPPETAGAPPGNDPSMEDILASIRRILSEEEPAPAPPAPVAAAIAAVEPPALDEKPDDVLLLDQSMLVEEEEARAAEPEPPAPEPPPRLAPPPMPPMEIMSPSALLAPEVEAAATISVGHLMRTLATERTMQVHRDGPTIEDVVREEVRPLLKQWLDANLPDLVERLVRAEIERVVGRAVP